MRAASLVDMIPARDLLKVARWSAKLTELFGIDIQFARVGKMIVAYDCFGPVDEAQLLKWVEEEKR